MKSMKYLVVFFLLCFGRSGSLFAQARETESVQEKFSKIEYCPLSNNPISVIYFTNAANQLACLRKWI